MVTIREAVPADAPAIARVHVDVWRTTYRGIVPDDYPRTLPYKDRESMWTRVLTATDSQVVFVAEDEHGEVIGFANGGPERSRIPSTRARSTPSTSWTRTTVKAWDAG